MSNEHVRSVFSKESGTSKSDKLSLHSSKESLSQSKSSDQSSELTQKNPLAEVMKFDYSFGYDCQQHFNLCVVDRNTLVYYSGTLIHIFHINEQTLEFQRSFSGSGVGHIVKNPKEEHLAVGEKGFNPLILIYDWPSFNIVSNMAGGTTHGYSHLDYSPDGTMLVSQGMEPDHLITIWDWQKAQIILRVKSHGQDVFNAEFSKFVPGQLTTSGLGHIKFWKMAKTFTGLKLQGELGRFGKTEICDILGICALPDEKVVSGSEWGNLLVWEDRLIKLEVRQKAKGNCHTAAISQIHFKSATQDIISVGMDGWVKVWTRATIDAVDPPDEEDWYLEMQPLLEVEVKDELGEAKLMSILKSDPNNEDDNTWFAQDGNGGIWSLNLSEDGSPPVRLLTCHSGHIVAIAPSPLGRYLASLDENGCLLIHDVTNRELLITKRFKAPATTLLWLPLHVEASGSVLVGGFADGMLRLLVASLRELEKILRSSGANRLSNEDLEYLNIIQKVKIHNGPITSVSLNPRGSILVTGSVDKTIFIHQIIPKSEYITLAPIGFVQLMAPVNYITWWPKQNATALVAIENGTLVQLTLPERSSIHTTSTYILSLDYEVLRIKSVKSELIRAQEIRKMEEKKKSKLEKKQEELVKIKADNPNLDINEELFLMDSDEETEFPPLYIPETPSPILFIIPLSNDNLYVSLGAYDCGFLYRYNFSVSGPVQSDPIPNALDIPIKSFLYVCQGKLLILGLANGVIRLVSCDDEVPNLNDYYDLAMHDPEHGSITQLCASSGESYLYSCGADGNVFTYQMNVQDLIGEAEEPKYGRKISRYMSLASPIPRERMEDASSEGEPTLEETKRNAEKLNQLKLSNEYKENVRRKLAKLRLRFELILSRNQILPESQILPHSVFELDPRITAALKDKIDADMAVLMHKIAFKVAKSRYLVQKMQNHFVDKIASLDVTVRAIKNEALRVKAFTHNKLTPEFLQAEKELQLLINVRPCISQLTYELSSRDMGSIVTLPRSSGLESMLKLAPFYNKMTLKARKAVIKHNAKKSKQDRRDQQWAVFLDIKPNINEDDPADILAYENAINSIGDFKLKSSKTYKVPEDKRITAAQKYWQIIMLHREIYETKGKFNQKVCGVRDSKVRLVRRFKQLYHDLDSIQKELSPTLQKQRLPVPKCWLKNNFPEHIFRLEFGADPTDYQPLSAPYDEEYHVLKVEKRDIISTDLNDVNTFKWAIKVDPDELLRLGADDDTDTGWEYEKRIMRRIKNLHEQELIITEMKKGVNDFDDALEKLSIDRLKYARDIKLMELFQLTLHLELIVIDSYSGQEDEINQRINAATQIRNDKMRQKALIQDAIDTKQQDIALWQMKLANVQEEMTEKLANNKFAKFLNHIFKKKRVFKRSDDSESESSSSEDTTDEDFEDEDNEDFIPIKLDENVCPEGCDPDIYENTICCRNLRYDIEDNITEIRKQLDEHQRDLQIFNKDLSKLELDVQKTTQELEAVQFEKQQKLNEIETVVVLSLSQFRHFVTALRPEDGLVKNPIVFHSEALISLAGRVRDLEKETEAEEIKITQQKALRQRLNKRCKEMKEIKKTLKKEIENSIISKFGAFIDTDLMEETVMKKMINQAKRDYQVDLLRLKYDKIYADLTSKLWKDRDSLIQVQNENTRRLKLQTMLHQETMMLNDLLKQQHLTKEKSMSYPKEETYEEEIRRIEDILKKELDYNNELRKEIRILSYKCTPPVESKPLLLPSEKGDAFNSHAQNKREFKEYSTEVKQKSEGFTEKEFTEQPSEETIVTIDKVLRRLASGASANDIAVALIEDMLKFPSDQTKITSAMDCAMRLVEELIIITTEDGTGDLLLVEHYAERLQRLAQSKNELNVKDLDTSMTENQDK